MQVRFTGLDDKVTIVEAPAGFSVMEAAVKNDVSGIDADCGGSCSCATCHVYINEPWLEHVGLPNAEEDDLLDIVDDRRSNSRLSCQIRLHPDLDGLSVTVASQS